MAEQTATLSDFISTTAVQEQLGMPAYTFSRRVRELDIAIYAAPHDKRVKLIRREDAERLREPVPLMRDRRQVAPL